MYIYVYTHTHYIYILYDCSPQLKWASNKWPNQSGHGHLWKFSWAPTSHQSCPSLVEARL